MASSFTIDKALLHALSSIGADVKRAIADSGIIASSDKISVSEKLFFKFMENIYKRLPSDDSVMRIINTDNLISFSPPSFAAFCSYNGNQCIERLIRYKKIVCPLIITKNNTSEKVRVTVCCSDGINLPPFMAELETAFIVQLIRQGTGLKIRPLKMGLPHDTYPTPLKNFYDCPIEHSDKAFVDFDPADMGRPFASFNETMWEIMQPGLEKQLTGLDSEKSFCNEVRRTILRLLPGGDCSIAMTAERLNVSVRTLQRRLAAENKTYYELLADIRHRQAAEYLKNPELSCHEISYLLGFKETNSFLRSFRISEGMTASAFRRNAKLFNEPQ